MHIKKIIKIGLSIALVTTGVYGNTASAIAEETTAEIVEESTTEAETSASNSAAEETSTPETSTPETSTPETSAPETSAPETSAPETSAPETSAPETSAPETSAPETSAPETSAPETSVPETSAPETVTQEITSTETSSETPEETSVTVTTAPQEQVEVFTETESQTISSGASSETEKETDNNTKAEKEESKETEKEDATDEGPEAEADALSPAAKALAEGIKNSPYATNAELIAHQNIVDIKPAEEDFRFTKTEAKTAVLKNGSKVYEDKDEGAEIVGNADEACIAYVLADSTEEWVYVESGLVRGFVKSASLVTGETADFIISRDAISSTATQTVPRTENAATTYTKTTAGDVIAEKEYAIAKEELSILDSTEKNAGTVGVLQKHGIAYILAETGNYYFVESGDARGFASKEALITGDYAAVKVAQNGESSYPVAETSIQPKDNKACYFTLTSVAAADETPAKRNAIVQFALQFVGNPYVWGGTSLTSGADCSGFVQSIYANFGYSLPRVACDQSLYGTQIPVADAEPGDLIFYAKQGYVYHVSMYIGDGKVVQAYSTKAGIITSDIGANSVWATKIIS